MTKSGLNAIEKYELAPFIDASCRREPDFENPSPSITALCRQGQFAPHLRVDDIVVYITVGDQFGPFKKGHHLVAILQVSEVYETHQIAETEYLNNNLPRPSNCMVINNTPHEFPKTGGNFRTKTLEKSFLSRTELEKEKIGERRIKIWDKDYLNKSNKWKCFIKTKILYLDINEPPLLLKSDFDYIFGKTPNTRTPNLISEKQLINLAKIAGLKFNMG
jgi:hypothetical protein